jgi:hypothetical protein
MEIPLTIDQQFTCERDGFVYTRRSDYPPFLCPRCTRFLAKGVVRLYRQIQPTTPNPKVQDI